MWTQKLQFFVALNLIYKFDFNNKAIDYIANINETNTTNKNLEQENILTLANLLIHVLSMCNPIM